MSGWTHAAFHELHDLSPTCMTAAGDSWMLRETDDSGQGMWRQFVLEMGGSRTYRGISFCPSRSLVFQRGWLSVWHKPNGFTWALAMTAAILLVFFSYKLQDSNPGDVPGDKNLKRSPRAGPAEASKSSSLADLEQASLESIDNSLSTVAQLIEASEYRPLSQQEKDALSVHSGRLIHYAWLSSENYMDLLDRLRAFDLPETIATSFVDAVFGPSYPVPELVGRRFHVALLDLFQTTSKKHLLAAAIKPLVLQDPEVTGLALSDMQRLLEIALDLDGPTAVRLIAASGNYTRRHPELLDRLLSIVHDESLTMDLRSAAIGASLRGAMDNPRSADFMANYLNSDRPDELRLAAAQNIFLDRESDGGDLPWTVVIQSVETERDPRVLGALLSALVKVGDRESLAAVRQRVFAGQEAEVLKSVAHAAGMSLLNSKAAYLDSQGLLVDVFDVASDSETQIAVVDSLIDLIPRTIYSGNREDLVNPVVGRTYTLDEGTLRNAYRAAALFREKGVQQTRDHIIQSARICLAGRQPIRGARLGV